MKTLLAKISQHPGAELRLIDDDGTSTVVPVTITKDGICYELPTNPSNRKWVNIKRFQTMEGEAMELEYKASRTVSRTTESAPRKGLEEYLEGDDKATYLALVEKAKANREAANKKAPMTEEEKLRRVIERAQAKIAKLTGAEA